MSFVEWLKHALKRDYLNKFFDGGGLEKKNKEQIKNGIRIMG